MPTENEPTTTYDRGWIVRIKNPRIATGSSEGGKPGTQARSLLLLHGLTGDETVMWIFTRNLPSNYWMFAPRAPVQAPGGGYSWLPQKEAREEAREEAPEQARENGWPKLEQFQEIARTLLDAFRRWAGDRNAPQGAFDVMGFSQGAAMAFALAAYFPQQINRVIALAGFLPEDETSPGHYSGLNGKKIYIAHGTKDETVPVQTAQQAVRTLQAAGAQVTYCESEVGHKLSADCLRGLEKFLI